MSVFNFNKAYKKVNKEYIEESATYHYHHYKWLMEKKKSRDLSIDRYNMINMDLKRLKLRIDVNDELCDKCKHSCNFKDMIEHEHKCFGFVGKTKFLKDTYSDETATCDKCNKVFYHTCKSSLPKYQLYRHQVVCEKTSLKRLKNEIKTQLDDLDFNTLNDIMDLIKNT